MQFARLMFSMIGLLVLTLPFSVFADDNFGTHGHVDSDGVKIHYVTSGEGALVVMIHGFPDYWYSWRNQIPELAKKYKVVAIDLRGFNNSDQPEGVESYAMDKLVGDVAAVVKHFKRDKATIVGHDWGGAIAWQFAMTKPAMTERLVVLNVPHFHCLQRELATNPDQKRNASYARAFQKEGSHNFLTSALLAGIVCKGKAARPHREKYVTAFKRSSIEGMMNIYKANYPREPYELPKNDPPKVACPVLMIHGLEDEALLPGGLNDTWNHVDNELTIVTIPKAAHWVQHDAPESVNRAILNWLP